MTITQAADPPPPWANEVQAVWLPFDKYLLWVQGKLRHAVTEWGERVELPRPWKPGEHWAFVGPTGEGKTTQVVPILDTRKYVLALDPKGIDTTLSKSGYTRVTSLPATGMARFRGEDQRAWRNIFKDIEQGRPARVIVGGERRTTEQAFALRDLLDRAIAFAQESQGWTLYVDEFEILSSQRMQNLRNQIDDMLITARDAGISVVTAYQAQAWVSHHASRQAKRVTAWPQSSRMLQALAEAMSREWRDMGVACDRLPPFHSVTVPKGKRGGPMVITYPPKM
jgi:hypothetical protein